MSYPKNLIEFVPNSIWCKKFIFKLIRNLLIIFFNCLIVFKDSNMISLMFLFVLRTNQNNCLDSYHFYSLFIPILNILFNYSLIKVILWIISHSFSMLSCIWSERQLLVSVHKIMYWYRERFDLIIEVVETYK